MSDRRFRVTLTMVPVLLLGFLARDSWQAGGLFRSPARAGEPPARSGPRRAPWGPEAARQLREWLAARQLTRAQEQSLTDMLADFHEVRQVEVLVGEVLASP